ncbi:asparagine synthase (glutamine-hydrolyzing) [Prosthecomicrobium sp. N25]|uniref:asparagine synthase (glutamine-hydrolyzing) n=1 Tax=Prosthecomicrobium sp. N25 TaxID=3129254 RepID=UPI003077438B
MCGIAGFFGNVAPAAAEVALLERMIAAIGHRGPDRSGILVEPGFGFAHARLAIIGLATGAQPMTTPDGSVAVTFNGEIFNYIELKAELAARGHRFRTDSDTEVILEAYRAWGPDCVTRFNGDFAFALHDAARRRLLVARDRMGVRPLFHATRGGCLYFASEVKALLEVPGIEAELDPVALDQIFTLWFPLAPRTPFKGIEELPPGHMILAEPGRTVVRPYWSLDYPDLGDAVDTRPEAAIRDELRALLLDATRIRLRSDVPVGAYLSGGLDSSIVTAAVKAIRPDRLKTFSVTFETDEFDEAPFQAAMVEALGTEHLSVRCTAGDIGRDFPDVIRATERPILRTAPAPLHRLSGLVHQEGYKVVLTGEGADEVFAGYDIFKEAKIRRFIAADPASAMRPRLLRRLYPYLPRLQGQSQKYLEAFFGVRADEAADPLFSHLPRFRSTAAAKVFFSAEMKAATAGYDALDDLRARLPERFHRWHPLSQAQYLECAHLLPGYILSSQGDRVAMAHAVEGRFPFLDHRVVEFAGRIPPRLKLRTLREKHILREAFADLLPPVIGTRPKQPYRAPDSPAFLGAQAPDWVAERLSPAALADTGVFDPRAVARLVAKCASGRPVGFKDNTALVGIVSTELWHRLFAPARSHLPLSLTA